MREKQIDFSAAIDFDGVDFIEPLDISTLFGNGIDNAIEASEKLPEEQRVVLIKAKEKCKILFPSWLKIIALIRIMQSRYAHQKQMVSCTVLVFPIWEEPLKKYGGTCTTTQENGKFTLKILIPVP